MDPEVRYYARPRHYTSVDPRFGELAQQPHTQDSDRRLSLLVSYINGARRGPLSLLADPRFFFEFFFFFLSFCSLCRYQKDALSILADEVEGPCIWR